MALSARFDCGYQVLCFGWHPLGVEFRDGLVGHLSLEELGLADLRESWSLSPLLLASGGRPSS